MPTDPTKAVLAAQWPHGRPLVSCRFDPSGKYAFCGSEDYTVQRFNIADGTHIGLAGHDSWVKAIAFSKDGSQVVTCGYDGRMIWWPALGDAPQPIRTVEGHAGWIRSAVMRPDGSLLATAGNDLVVRLWNVADGTLVKELPGHEKVVWSVEWDPSGKFLMSGDLGGVLKQWDVDAGTVARTFDCKPLHTYEGGQMVDFGGVRALSFSPDGKYLAAGGLHKGSNPLGAVHEPLVLLFDWAAGTLVRQQLTEGIPGGVIWRLRHLNDGTLVAASGGSSGGLLLFFKPDADKDFHRFALPNILRDADLHPDGLRLATAHHDGHLRLTSVVG
ncbi:MAG: WD40 repeat domain-containing protein [Planctomycetaceae bacterium]